MASHLSHLVTCIHSESQLHDLTDALGVRPPDDSVSPHQHSACIILGHWYATQLDPRTAYDKLTTLLEKAGKKQLLFALQSSVDENVSDKTVAISLSGNRFLGLFFL